jgi:hypothetical protein
MQDMDFPMMEISPNHERAASIPTPPRNRTQVEDPSAIAAITSGLWCERGTPWCAIVLVLGGIRIALQTPQ